MEELLLSAEGDMARSKETLNLYFGRKKREPLAKILSFVVLCFRDLAPHSEPINGLTVHLTDTEAGLSRVGLLDRMLHLALEKEHTVDFAGVEEACNVIFSLPTSTGMLGVVDFSQVYSEILKVLAIFLRQVVNRLPSFHFKLISLISKFIQASENHYSRALIKLLIRLLERFGDYFTDVLKTTTSLITKSLIEHLEALNITHPVHLQSASKLRNRKVGNGHQRKRLKNRIKRSENTKLKLLNKETLDNSIEIKLVKAELRYITAILVTNPDYQIELPSFYRLGNVSEELQEPFLTAALHFAIFDKM